MHFYIEIRDGELLSTSNIGGVEELHGPGLEGVKNAHASIIAAQLRERMRATARQQAADMSARIFKAQFSKSEQQLKLHLLGKLIVEMPIDHKPFFKVLSSDGSELYTGHDLSDAVKSLSSPTLKSPSLG